MLQKTAEYALRAVACLASLDEQQLAADLISERSQIPRRYLQKVLQSLVESGLVLSRPGPGGGYRLAHPRNDITILDVISAVSPLERLRHCPLGLPSHTKLCPLHQELDNVYAATEAAFSRVTIGQLLESNSEMVPLCNVACD